MTSTIVLRDYQKIDIAAIKSAWEEYRSVLYQLPTGGGKSVVITQLVNDYKKENILIFAHKRKLLTQLKAHLAKVGIRAGLQIASKAEDMDSNIVIVSIRTAVKDARLETLLERNWDRVIIDEARHSRTNSYDKVLDAILEKHPNHRLLGVDATPYRKDKKRLDKHFQYMVTSIENTASLIGKGYLAKYRTYVAPIGEIEQEVEEVANDYQQTQLSHYMRKPEYLNYVVNMYRQYGKNRQAIVFAVDKEHAKSLKKTFLSNGFTGVEQMDSDMSVEEIERITESYENGTTRILINIEMLTEGVDLPDTGCIVGARPTKSLTLYLQMVGRGTRPKSDGSELIVLDCSGWTEAFGQLSSSKHWSLNPEINPNNPRLNNRVVGKKSDGTYEEDLTDFIGEVVEMTPEEYLNSVQNGLERATEINVSIDDKIANLLQAIAEMLAELFKRNKSEYDMKVDTSRGREISIIWSDINSKESKDWNKILVRVNLDLKRRLYATLESNRYGGVSDNQIPEYMRMSKLAGILNTALLENSKTEVQCLELFEQVVDLQKTKINLDAFKEASKKFTEEQWQKSVIDYCA
jgi:superfamily II DNA or RNA helicase